MYKWDISIAASIILRERITNTGGIPYMVMDLLESVFARSGDEGHALESISYGGAPSSSGLPESIVKKLGQAVQPSQGYGATEFSSMATGVGGEDFLLRELLTFRLTRFPADDCSHRSHKRWTSDSCVSGQDRRRARPGTARRQRWRHPASRRNACTVLLEKPRGHSRDFYGRRVLSEVRYRAFDSSQFVSQS